MKKREAAEKTKIQSFHVVYYIILTICALVVALPFLWLLQSSFDYVKSYTLPFAPRIWPENPSLFNYEMALQNIPILTYLLNTFIIIIISLVLTVFVSTLSGFCFSKGQFKGKGILLIIILSSMMIPFETKLMPVYNIVKGVGLSNNYFGVVLPSVVTCSMYIFFVKQFCDDLPNDLYEAGIIDGANKFRIYFQIFLPLMTPIIATIVVLDTVNIWNDLLWPLIVLTDSKMSTLQIGLVVYNSGSNGQVHAGIQTALSMLSIAPLAVVFCFMQKYIVASVATTGLKQ